MESIMAKSRRSQSERQDSHADNLTKRAIRLTSWIIILFVIALLAFLDGVGSRRHGAILVAYKELTGLQSRLIIPERLNRKNETPDWLADPGREGRQWLAAHNPSLSQRNVRVREEIR